LPPHRILAAPAGPQGLGRRLGDSRRVFCALKFLPLFASILLLAALVSFYTLTLSFLACMSRFPTFSYPKNACKKVEKGLEVGNGRKRKQNIAKFHYFKEK